MIIQYFSLQGNLLNPYEILTRMEIFSYLSTSYIYFIKMEAKNTDAAIPANVAVNAPANVHLIFFTLIEL